MPTSAATLAKRALVSVILRLAVAYLITLAVNRDSPDERITAAYRKLVLKVHPDKGGRVSDMQELQEAKVELEAAAANVRKGGGRPRQS